MKSDYRRAQFEPMPIERASKSELENLREWARKHPSDFCYVKRSKKMVKQLKSKLP